MVNGNEMDMALPFIPLLWVFFCGPGGVFAELAACWGHWEHVDEGEGISDLFAVHSVFSYPGQVASFVCLFSVLVAGEKKKRWRNGFIGFGGIFLYGHPLISAMSHGCGGDAAGI